MTQPAGFPLEPGDTVTYLNGHGFQSGYFVRWDRNGSAVVRKPAGGHATLAPSLLRPCNDGRMVALRGFVEWPTPPDSTPPPSTKRKR